MLGEHRLCAGRQPALRLGERGGGAGGGGVEGDRVKSSPLVDGPQGGDEGEFDRGVGGGLGGDSHLAEREDGEEARLVGGVEGGHVGEVGDG